MSTISLSLKDQHGRILRLPVAYAASINNLAKLPNKAVDIDNTGSTGWGAGSTGGTGSTNGTGGSTAPGGTGSTGGDGNTTPTCTPTNASFDIKMPELTTADIGVIGKLLINNPLMKAVKDDLVSKAWQVADYTINVTITNAGQVDCKFSYKENGGSTFYYDKGSVINAVIQTNYANNSGYRNVTPSGNTYTKLINLEQGFIDAVDRGVYNSAMPSSGAWSSAIQLGSGVISLDLQGEVLGANSVWAFRYPLSGACLLYGYVRRSALKVLSDTEMYLRMLALNVDINALLQLDVPKNKRVDDRDVSYLQDLLPYKQFNVKTTINGYAVDTAFTFKDDESTYNILTSKGLVAGIVAIKSTVKQATITVKGIATNGKLLTDGQLVTSNIDGTVASVPTSINIALSKTKKDGTVLDAGSGQVNSCAVYITV